MYEQIKRIKCPNCETILDIKNSKDEAVKLITCPQCKATLKVKFKELNIMDAQTYYSGASKDGETKYGGYKDNVETQLHKGTSNVKAVYLNVDGKSYPLSIGTNIVGRKGSTSQATVQIETSDHYMSRQHAKIVVTRLPDGRLKAVISNDHNKNITTIDGQDLLQGDAIVLENGDRIVMGNTTVTFKEL